MFVVLSVVPCTLSAVCKNKHANSLGCFVQYRVAFYVAGELESLNNAFMLIDGYLQYKNKQLARATPFEVHIHPHTAVGDLSSLRDQMSYPSITVHEASESHSPSLAKNTRAKATPGTSEMIWSGQEYRARGPRTTDTTVSSRTWTSPIVMGSKKSCLWLIYCTSRLAGSWWTQRLSPTRPLRIF